MQIHGTVFVEPDGGSSVLPKFVQNHGILPGPELHALLAESKVTAGFVTSPSQRLLSTWMTAMLCYKLYKDIVVV